MGYDPYSLGIDYSDLSGPGSASDASGATSGIAQGAATGAMGGPMGMLIGAGIGAGKSILFDQPAALRKNILNAQLTKYSPWTHFKITGDTEDPTGKMGQNMAAMGGAGLTYGLQNQKPDFFQQALFSNSSKAKGST